MDLMEMFEKMMKGESTKEKDSKSSEVEKLKKLVLKMCDYTLATTELMVAYKNVDDSKVSDLLSIPVKNAVESLLMLNIAKIPLMERVKMMEEDNPDLEFVDKVNKNLDAMKKALDE